MNTVSFFEPKVRAQDEESIRQDIRAEVIASAIIHAEYVTIDTLRELKSAVAKYKREILKENQSVFGKENE